MRFDAAIGNGQGLSVRQQDDLVRTDAIGVKLTDPGIAALDVEDPDHPARLVEIVLGRIEQLAVG
jgi:hypothetical protein